MHTSSDLVSSSFIQKTPLCPSFITQSRCLGRQIEVSDPRVGEDSDFPRSLVEFGVCMTKYLFDISSLLLNRVILYDSQILDSVVTSFNRPLILLSYLCLDTLHSQVNMLSPDITLTKIYFQLLDFEGISILFKYEVELLNEDVC